MTVAASNQSAIATLLPVSSFLCSDDSDNESPPSDDEGNVFEWAEENLEDEYWKNDN